MDIELFYPVICSSGIDVFFLTPVFAHVPTFEEGGKNPETATRIENPAKSRVLYGQLSEGDLQYYSFEVEE